MSRKSIVKQIKKQKKNIFFHKINTKFSRLSSNSHARKTNIKIMALSYCRHKHTGNINITLCEYIYIYIPIQIHTYVCVVCGKLNLACLVFRKTPLVVLFHFAYFFFHSPAPKAFRRSKLNEIEESYHWLPFESRYRKSLKRN